MQRHFLKSGVAVGGISICSFANANTPGQIIALVVGHLTLLVIIGVLISVWPVAWQRKLAILVLYIAGLAVAILLDEILVGQADWIRIASLFALPCLSSAIGVVLMIRDRGKKHLEGSA